MNTLMTPTQGDTCWGNNQNYAGDLNEILHGTAHGCQWNNQHKSCKEVNKSPNKSSWSTDQRKKIVWKNKSKVSQLSKEAQSQAKKASYDGENLPWWATIHLLDQLGAHGPKKKKIM